MNLTQHQIQRETFHKPWVFWSPSSRAAGTGWRRWFPAPLQLWWELPAVSCGLCSGPHTAPSQPAGRGTPWRCATGPLLCSATGPPSPAARCPHTDRPPNPAEGTSSGSPHTGPERTPAPGPVLELPLRLSWLTHTHQHTQPDLCNNEEVTKTTSQGSETTEKWQEKSTRQK